MKHSTSIISYPVRVADWIIRPITDDDAIHAIIARRRLMMVGLGIG